MIMKDNSPAAKFSETMRGKKKEIIQQLKKQLPLAVSLSGIDKNYLAYHLSSISAKDLFDKIDIVEEKK